MSKEIQVTDSKKSVTQMITRSLNKKGEIKGKNKKETKNLRSACCHHRLNKRGKIRSAISNDGNGVCTCELCKAKFTTHVATKDEIKEVTGNFMEYVNQAKYSTVAANLGRNTENYLAKLSVEANQFPKVYTNIGKVISKKEKNTKKKKNARRGGGGDSEKLGSWR